MRLERLPGQVREGELPRESHLSGLRLDRRDRERPGRAGGDARRRRHLGSGRQLRMELVRLTLGSSERHPTENESGAQHHSDHPEHLSLLGRFRRPFIRRNRPAGLQASAKTQRSTARRRS